MTEPAGIRVRELEHRPAENFVLQIDQLDLDPGVHHLAGANGAGKTTLLRILATLVTPRRGEIQVAGADARRQGSHVRARIGYVGHEASVHAALTARENLQLHARLHGADEARVEQALSEWGLEQAAHRATRALSHGQRKRLDLARATLHEPRVLLLDEPASGLDRAGRERLEALVQPQEPRTTLVAAPGAPGVDVDRRLVLTDGRLEGEHA